MANEANEVVVCRDGDWTIQPAGITMPRFIRPNGHLAQVTPTKSNETVANLLADFIPVKKRDDLEMLAAWIVGCFKPNGPFPVLIINGEQGSAKSTTTRVLRKLVDPNSRDIVEPRRIIGIWWR
jgi:hypothetical protein